MNCDINVTVFEKNAKKCSQLQINGLHSPQNMVECIHKIKIDGELYYGFKFCTKSYH